VLRRAHTGGETLKTIVVQDELAMVRRGKSGFAAVVLESADSVFELPCGTMDDLVHVLSTAHAMTREEEESHEV